MIPASPSIVACATLPSMSSRQSRPSNESELFSRSTSSSVEPLNRPPQSLFPPIRLSHHHYAPCHLVTLLPCHLVTLSPGHFVTLSPPVSSGTSTAPGTRPCCRSCQKSLDCMPCVLTIPSVSA